LSPSTFGVAFSKGKTHQYNFFFSLVFTSHCLIVICLTALSGTCKALERKRKKDLPFSSCKEVLSKCFLAADDNSTAYNTFLQLISGKKPDVTALQFAKPIGVLRFCFFFLTTTEVEGVSIKSCYKHLTRYELKQKQELPC